MADSYDMMEPDDLDGPLADDGGEQDEAGLESTLARLQAYTVADNIAAALDDDHLGRIAHQVLEEFAIDERSRADWAETAGKMMDVALQVREAKNTPFEGAANIKYPLLTVAALQFNARAYPAICDGQGVVKAVVVGEDEGLPQTGPDGQPVVDQATGQPAMASEPGAKQRRADRISEHMSWQLMEEMVEWEEDTDMLLMQLPIVGCAFRKVFYDSGPGRNRAEMVSAMDLVVNSNTRTLDEAPRVSQCISLYPHEIDERIRDGRFVEFDYGDSDDGSGDGDAPHEFIEQHRWLDLDDDGFREPYIVTVHKQGEKVCRIAANFRIEDISTDGERITRIGKHSYFVKYSFLPDPRGGFYDIGFGRLLESIGAAIDTTLNQMLDAGHLQNAGGGFIGSGVHFGKANIRLRPGHYQTVNAAGQDIRNAIVQMQHPGPSPVLFQLLGLLIEAAKDITAVKDVVTGDSGNKVQTATTTLALIEQGLKVFTAIYKRVYRAMKAEFKLLYDLNAEHLPDKAYFNVLDTPKAVARDDYAQGDMDIMPVADPSAVTDMQKIARMNVVAQYIGTGLQDDREALRRLYEVARIDDIDALLPEPQGPSPQEQMAMANADAEIRAKGARAMRDEAAGKKDLVEAALAEPRHQLEADKHEVNKIMGVVDAMSGENGQQSV